MTQSIFVERRSIASPIVQLAAKRGNHPVSFRDAVHEITHVLQAGLRGTDWNRDKIHTKLEKRAELTAITMGKSESRLHTFSYLWRWELQARAVEALACKELREPYDYEHWALMAWLETSKAYRVDAGAIDQIVDMVKRAERTPIVLRLRDRVLRFGKRAS